MESATWVLASATIGLVIATGILAYSTYRYTKATKRMEKMSRVDFSFRLFSASVTMNDPDGIYVKSLIRGDELAKNRNNEVWSELKSVIKVAYTDLTREFLEEERERSRRHSGKNHKN